ncbi:MAG: NADH-quinone oxidoreductase subunit L [Myxococcota bacterium]
MSFLATVAETVVHAAEHGVEAVEPGQAHPSQFIGWIVLLPLLGAFINGVFGRRLSKRTVTTIAIGTVGLAFVFALLEVLRLGGLGKNDFIVSNFWRWFDSGEVTIRLDFMIDHLSAVMILIVTGVGGLIHVFSTAYMREDEGYWKFFAYLNLFMFAMICLVLGKNLIVLFVGWEGVGLCSYLLIGFWYKDMEKAAAGQKAFVANRIGDLAFLIATFLLLYYTHGNVDFVGDDGNGGGIRAAVTHLSGQGQGGELTLLVICCLYFVAATGKSAQIPLFTWLPDAMAGPTPVSALIHAATMVTAGVYMICRMNFMFSASPGAMTVIAVVGGVTALFAATIALVQNDIKKVLAYSTVSQLGFMVLAAGSGAYVAAIFHLMTHAFFKACLFLGSGSVIHAMHHEQDIRKMGGLRKKLPITAITFFASCLAIAGIPFFSGFFSKDEILFNAMTTSNAAGTTQWVAGLLGFLAAACTAFYMFRLYYLTFEGEYRGDHHTYDHAHEETAMTFPLIVLGVLATIGGFVGIPHLLGEHVHLLDNWLEPVFAGSVGLVHPLHGAEATVPELLVIGISVLIGIIGLVMARSWYKVPAAALPRAPVEAGWHKLLTNKYYVDEAYDFLFVRPMRRTAKFLYEFVDVGLIDGVFVRGSAKVVGAVGSILRLFQTGDVQAYVTVLVVGLMAALLVAI